MAKKQTNREPTIKSLRIEIQFTTNDVGQQRCQYNT